MQLVFPKSVLITIYNALILPYINYCLLSWGLDTSVKNIFMQQKKAIRAISSAGYNAHTEPLFKLYNVLKVEDIYNYRLLVLYYNIKHNKVPNYITSFLPNTSIRIRIRIRIILFWINKYEYNLCYNDIYTYKHNSRINPGNRYKDMCRGTSVTIRLPGQ